MTLTTMIEQQPARPLMLRSSQPKSLLPLLPLRISYIEHQNLRFIINDCPSETNLPEYISEFKKYNVSDIVRVCEPSYSSRLLQAESINLHDWPFEDGGIPPDALINNWLALVKSRFGAPAKSDEDLVAQQAAPVSEKPTLAVHCVAGLGRAPVLVAIALIEYGMEKLDAIEFIRRKRRGAFNSRQIQYIDSYKKQSLSKAILKSTLSRMFRFRGSSASSDRGSH